MTDMIIAIASQKGGVAKTTTSLALSAGLAHKNKKVLLIDIDPQANSAKVMLDNYEALSVNQTIYGAIMERRPLTIYPTKLNHLCLAPSHILLSNADTGLVNEIDRYFRLKDQLEAIENSYDYVVIDCPHTLGVLTLNALTAADQVIVPVAPGFFEFDSLIQLADVISAVQKRLNSQLQLAGYLYVRSTPTTQAADNLQQLRKAYSGKVFQTVIPQNVAAAEAHQRRLDIFSYQKDSRAAQEYNRFIYEFLKI